MRTSRSPASAVLVLAMALSLSWPASSQTACNAAAFGSLTQDPITITGPWTIGNNCTLNFGFRHVILGPTTALTVTNATILAGQLSMQGGATIASGTATPGALTIATIPRGAADGSVLVEGSITLISDPSGGSVAINAGGTFTTSAMGTIRVGGNAAASTGGTVTIMAVGSVALGGQQPCIDARGNEAAGGMVTVQSLSSQVMVSKSVLADGRLLGGQISISSYTSLTTADVVSATGEVVDAIRFGQGGSITLTAGTLLAVGAELRTNVSNLVYPGFPCPSPTVGSGGPIFMSAPGGIDLGATADLRGCIFGAGGDLNATTGGTFRQLTGSMLLSNPAIGTSGTGGRLTINAGNAIQLLGTTDVSAASCDIDYMGTRGAIILNAVNDIDVTGLLINRGVLSVLPDAIVITSSTGDVNVGPVDLFGYSGTYVRVHAGRDIHINSDINASAPYSNTFPWSLDFQAVGDLLVAGSINDSYPGGTISFQGCRVAISPGTTITVEDGFFGGGTVAITARDLIEVHGSISALGEYKNPSTDGTITLITRVGSPHSPLLGGSAITPAPIIVHDNTMPPCLALLTTSLTGPSPLVPGGMFIVNLDSVPSRPVLVLANLTLQHFSLGALGWTQLNPFGMPAILADPGALGPPLPGSTTDANGHWGFELSTAGVPGLSGLTVFVDAYVLDPNAANGVFHQPPYLAVLFQ